MFLTGVSICSSRVVVDARGVGRSGPAPWNNCVAVGAGRPSAIRRPAAPRPGRRISGVPPGGPPLQLGRRPGPRKSHRLFEVISVFGQVELQVEVEGARCKHVVPKLKSRVQGAIATAVW